MWFGLRSDATVVANSVLLVEMVEEESCGDIIGRVGVEQVLGRQVGSTVDR
jgi:hypothetical protein